MTAIHSTAPDTVLVAIDIAKHRHEVLIAIPGKKRRKRMTVLSNKTDHERLVSFLSGLGKQAAMRSKSPICFARSRSKRTPASEVIFPPSKAAKTVRDPKSENRI